MLRPKHFLFQAQRVLTSRPRRSRFCRKRGKENFAFHYPLQSIKNVGWQLFFFFFERCSVITVNLINHKEAWRIISINFLLRLNHSCHHWRAYISEGPSVCEPAAYCYFYEIKMNRGKSPIRVESINTVTQNSRTRATLSISRAINQLDTF